MKTQSGSLSIAAFLAASCTALADVHYVDAQSQDPRPPYATWATAARVIQEAVDVAPAGDEIVVTNGIYATGGRAVYGAMTNRVAVDKPLTLQSINGPDVTIIRGYQVPGTTNGDGAIRCAFLADGAVLSGFTLTNGATGTAGDYDKEQTGGGVWCVSTQAVLTNCVLAGNSAMNNSGGASLGTLINCVLTRNTTLATASFGGGASGSVLNHCTLTGNSAFSEGGGAGYSTLSNCILTGNSASSGGGAYSCALINCAVSGNLAAICGGGVYEGRLTNCTVTGNSASTGGGGYDATLNNCIVYFLGQQNLWADSGSGSFPNV